MKHLTRILCSTLLVITAQTPYAHPDGHRAEGRPINQQQAAERAELRLDLMLRNEQLDASWKSRQLQESKMEKFGDQPLWVVVYRNPTEKDKTKQLLYVFFDWFGNYVDTNHTGTPRTA